MRRVLNSKQYNRTLSIFNFLEYEAIIISNNDFELKWFGVCYFALKYLSSEERAAGRL